MDLDKSVTIAVIATGMSTLILILSLDIAQLVTILRSVFTS